MLKGVVALITGGAQGLGRGFAEIIVKEGGKVAIVDIYSCLGRETEEVLNKKFGDGSVKFIDCNITDQDAFENAFKETKERFGKLNLIVNNAGVLTLSYVQQRTIHVNLTSVMHGINLAAKYMPTERGQYRGHIVNIGRDTTLSPTTMVYDPAYTTSKNCVEKLTEYLGPFYGDHGLRMNALCPSYTTTNLLKSAKEYDYDRIAEGLNDALLKSINESGEMTVDEVSEAFKTLLIEKADHSGVVMRVSKKEGRHYSQQGSPAKKLE